MKNVARKMLAVGLVLSMTLAMTSMAYAATAADSAKLESKVVANTTKMIDSVYALPKDNVSAVMNQSRNYLVVVNKDHPIDLDGSYIRELQADLVYFPNVVDGDTMAVEKAAYLAFKRLQRDLEVTDGIRIDLYDGYRTAKDQEFLIEQGTSNMASEPGYSEHHTGLLLDYVLWYSEDGSKYDWYSDTPERHETIPEFGKVCEKMVDYGFINRFPDGKEDITGIEYIPYEIRFVGNSKVAHAIADNDLTLEEFVLQ